MSQEKSTLTEEQNVKIYKETSKPIKKPKRKNKSDLGPDFVAPDGGWGWVICVAAGLSTFSIFPSLQQYGILYRNRMHQLGFEGKQVTSVINIEVATSTLLGVVNGALFRRFTFRQVAITGGIFAFVGITLTAFCQSFVQYVLCFSFIYGMGVGMNTSATALAVNTYFKKHRRRATGLTWTITGLGPIIFPHISTYLLKAYGTQTAILIIGAIALVTVALGSTLQPVLWHVKPKKAATEQLDDEGQEPMTQENVNAEPDHLCKYCRLKQEGSPSIFSSQYLFSDNDADDDRPGLEVIEPGTPMFARANDGWFSQKDPLSSEHRRTSIRSLSEETEDRDSLMSKSNYFNQEREERLRNIKENRCTCAEERELIEKSIEDQNKKQNEIEEEKEEETPPKPRLSFGRKVVKFFDLDLLCDLTFVNLVQGLTIMMFGETNFAFLTPFILNSHGYGNEQISLAMSLLGGCDMVMRFLSPFLFEKIKFGNSTLFAAGILIISIGRCLVALIHSYNALLGFFMIIGIGKAFRTIFAPLILPSYVPLNRLPAAVGLQLVSTTLISLAFGPLLGLIADKFSYNVAIHFINLTSTLSLMLWVLEWVVRRMLRKPKSHTQQH